MKRIFIFFLLLGGGGFFYLSLPFLNLRLALENSRLREKKMLLERDRKLIILEISKVSAIKNLEEGYLTSVPSATKLASRPAGGNLTQLVESNRLAGSEEVEVRHEVSGGEAPAISDSGSEAVRNRYHPPRSSTTNESFSLSSISQKNR